MIENQAGLPALPPALIPVFLGVMSASLPRPIYLFMLHFSKAKLGKIESRLHAIPPRLQVSLTIRGTKYAILIYNNKNNNYFLLATTIPTPIILHMGGCFPVGTQSVFPAVISFEPLSVI